LPLTAIVTAANASDTTLFAAVLILFLGAAFEDLLFAFQILYFELQQIANS